MRVKRERLHFLPRKQFVLKIRTIVQEENLLQVSQLLGGSKGVVIS